MMQLNNGIWKDIMMHNSLDWLMTCRTYAMYCAYCKTMDNTYETRLLLTPYSNYMIRWSPTTKKASRHLFGFSEKPTARRFTFLSRSWHLPVHATGKNWFSLMTCSFLLLLRLVTTTTFIR